MKICILGNFTGRLDEGMGNVAYHLHHHIKKNKTETILINVNQYTSLSFWKNIRSFQPDILHLIPGPTTKLLILLKILKILTHSKTIISATKNALKDSFKKTAKFLEPDGVIVNSEKTEKFFKSINYKTKFIPNGVDLEKFSEISNDKKIALRKKFNFNEDDFILLHIGPILRGRNQKSLTEISNVKILLIQSITNPSDEKEIKKIKSSNVTIMNNYISNIEEIYHISNVYVFPVFDSFQSIEIPLTVLEAMSCNLPVITTNYGGGLTRIFNEGDGLFFIKNPSEMNEAIEKIRNNDFHCKTRDQVELCSWQNVTNQILKFYDDILE